MISSQVINRQKLKNENLEVEMNKVLELCDSKYNFTFEKLINDNNFITIYKHFASEFSIRRT